MYEGDVCIAYTDTQNIQPYCLVWQAASTSSACATLGKSGSSTNTSDTNQPKALCGFLQFIQANVRRLLQLGYENFLPNPSQYITVIKQFTTTQTELLTVSLNKLHTNKHTHTNICVLKMIKHTLLYEMVSNSSVISSGCPTICTMECDARDASKIITGCISSIRKWSN